MYVKLLGETKGLDKYDGFTPEEIVSAIARHGVIKNDNGKLVRYLMNEKHWSPLDMINFVFEIETSRAIGRQMLRHASLKAQEHSQRYSDRVLFEEVEFRKEHPTNRQSSTEAVALVDYLRNDAGAFNDSDFGEFADEGLGLLKKINQYYRRGIEMGLAKECMRMFLPECTTTTMTFNGTLRSWLSFLNVRCDHHSQLEIQQIANLIGTKLEEAMPNVFSQIDWRKGMFM